MYQKQLTKGDLRIVFVGTPEFAAGSLRALVEGDYNAVAVIIQPDEPVGCHHDTLQTSEVKEYALAQGLPVLQLQKMKDPAFVEQLAGYKADLQVVMAFRMLPEVVWAMPLLDIFNVYAALLPQYRGAAPINWAVINGETTTGATTFFLDHQIDTGRIIPQKTMPIPDDADVEYAYNRFMVLGAQLCLEAIDQLIENGGEIPSMPQEHYAADEAEPHQAPKIFKKTCQTSWHQPAKHAYNFIRGLSPYPAAQTIVTDGNGKQQTLKIYKSGKTNLAADETPGTMWVENKKLYFTAEDSRLGIIELQMAGKKRMKAKDFLNGWRE